MIQSARKKFKLAALSLLILLAVRAFVSTTVIRTGFRALSDDDFSRVVIAQSFVLHPSWDPSGTSWLPFPFWLYGACLSFFGASLSNARIVAFALGLLSTIGVWTAGRWLGLTRNASLLAGVIACCIPYSAWLGVATTPEYYNAILILLACCSLARAQRLIRCLGAIAISMATLSRYEAWPVAVVWAGFVSIDALRSRNWKLFALALCVLAAPVAWMLHGISHHLDALFFVKRVVSYRRALGVVDGNTAARLLATPRHLFGDAPELWAITIVSGLASWLRKSQPWRRRWIRPSLAVSSIIVFLVVGDWRDGAATHHVGRTLLPLWFFVALITAKTIVSYEHRATLTKGVGFFLLGACLALGFLHPTWTKVDGFCPRREETEIGMQASAKILSGQHLAIDTNDYGYFAVEAAFARPNDVAVLDTHDPRHPAAMNAFSSSAALQDAMEKHHAKWLVLQRTHESRLPITAQIHFRGRTLLLAELR